MTGIVIVRVISVTKHKTMMVVVHFRCNGGVPQDDVHRLQKLGRFSASISFGARLETTPIRSRHIPCWLTKLHC